VTRKEIIENQSAPEPIYYAIYQKIIKKQSRDHITSC